LAFILCRQGAQVNLATVTIHCVVIALWLVVLIAVLVAYYKNDGRAGATKLLIIVVAIDTIRNIIENSYFSVYFGSKFGFISHEFSATMDIYSLIIIPKLLNVLAAVAVIVMLVRRGLPKILRERSEAVLEVREKSIALAQELEEQRSLFEASADLIVVTDRERVIKRISNSCENILGYKPAEMIGLKSSDVISSVDAEKSRLMVELAFQNVATRNVAIHMNTKDGKIVPMALTVVWSESAQRFFTIGRDVSERQEAEAKLELLAHFDQMTDLRNRTSFIDDLELNLDARTEGGTVSLALFDLDGFKNINDTLGHSVGDRVLQLVAERLREFMVGEARFYRFGGDEFCLLMPGHTDVVALEAAAASILKRLEDPFEVNGHQLFIGASAGLAVGPNHGSVVEDLVSNADLALYDAKSAGGRRYRIFDQSMFLRARARHNLEVELRRACSNGEFTLHYQPQFRLSDGAIVGAEALLRWQHPQNGLLSPASFFEVLAGSAMAMDLGNWVLQTACQFAASLGRPAHQPLRISVNLFPVQCSGRLICDVETALHLSGLPAECHELEITENIALDRDEEILKSLQTLRKKGIGLAFDDFGTGYASLSYLARYPLTRIKIDRSFIGGLCETSPPEESTIARSLIVMAHNLGLSVVAEGVETAFQATFLRLKKCDEAQGYFFSKPVCAEAFKALLAAEGHLQSTDVLRAS
jgi:diguanylate cyclase (GGDEF)-like protein/PAS domain S-box-containing protein